MKRLGPIWHILGTLLMFFSLSMLPPILVDFIYRDGGLSIFVINFLLTFCSGLLLKLIFHKQKRELKSRDGFLVVVILWVVLSLFGALPFWYIQRPHFSFVDAVFESVSGLTTTGASVLSNLESLPHSLIYYRQQLQFLGGMGIIVLAIAILPMLGVGGMQLFRAETPGPMKDTKLTPRITSTAKALWTIYLALFILCVLSYWAAGMTLFEAIGESFGTISTGGFSLHSNSFSYYHSATIDLIACVFMLLGATNFSLHFISIRQFKFKHYLEDAEFKTYIILIIFLCVLVTAVLMNHHVYDGLWTTFVQALFHIVSSSTTTGFVDSHFAYWPTFLPYLVMILAIIGGCSSSTSGGAKVIRILLAYKQATRAMLRLIHPRAVLPIKFGRQILPDPIMEAMWAFLAVYFALFVFLTLVLLADGVDVNTAYGSVSAALGNAGTSIGQTVNSFKCLSPLSKWILIFAMLAGRLEVFTIFILFHPAYWRR